MAVRISTCGRFVGTLLYKPTIKMENSFMRHVVNGFTFSGTATEANRFPDRGFDD